MKFPDSIKLISPYLARVLAVTLAFCFLIVYLLQDNDLQSKHRELILVLELDPVTKQSNLDVVKEEIIAFANDHSIDVDIYGRADAEKLLREEIPSFKIDKVFEQEAFLTLITLHAKNKKEVLSLQEYHESLSFKNGITQSTVIDTRAEITDNSVGFTRWVYLIPVLISVLIYLLLTKLSYHNRLQLRKRERYAIDFIGGDQRKWLMGIRKSGMLQNIKLLMVSLMLSIILVVLLNYSCISVLGDKIVVLTIAIAVMLLALFFISQWIIHSQLKRLNVR